MRINEEIFVKFYNSSVPREIYANHLLGKLGNIARKKENITAKLYNLAY